MLSRNNSAFMRQLMLRELSTIRIVDEHAGDLVFFVSSLASDAARTHYHWNLSLDPFKRERRMMVANDK